MNHYLPTPKDGIMLPNTLADHHYDAGIVGISRPFRVALSPIFSSSQTTDPLVSLHDEVRMKGETSTALLSLTGVKADKPTKSRVSGKARRTLKPVQDDINKLTERHKLRRAETSQSRRREQCRANQARYRDKQRSAQMALEKSVEQLHLELDVLKRKYQSLSFRERKNNQTSWSITADFFRLIEISFRSPSSIFSTREIKTHTKTRQLVTILRRAFARDVGMGELQSADVLLEQLRLYSHYFGDPDLQLQQIESLAPNVTAAQAKLSVTVTEITLQHVFPHVKEPADGDQAEDGREHLYQRLLGQCLECSCLMSFLFNSSSNRVVRVVATIDFVPALLRVLGSLTDVSKVLEHAQVTLESVVGKFDATSDNHSQSTS